MIRTPLHGSDATVHAAHALHLIRGSVAQENFAISCHNANGHLIRNMGRSNNAERILKERPLFNLQQLSLILVFPMHIIA